MDVIHTSLLSHCLSKSTQNSRIAKHKNFAPTTYNGKVTSSNNYFRACSSMEMAAYQGERNSYESFKPFFVKIYSELTVCQAQVYCL